MNGKYQLPDNVKQKIASEKAKTASSGNTRFSNSPEFESKFSAAKQEVDAVKQSTAEAEAAQPEAPKKEDILAEINSNRNSQIKQKLDYAIEYNKLKQTYGADAANQFANDTFRENTDKSNKAKADLAIAQSKQVTDKLKDYADDSFMNQLLGTTASIGMSLTGLGDVVDSVKEYKSTGQVTGTKKTATGQAMPNATRMSDALREGATEYWADKDAMNGGGEFWQKAYATTYSIAQSLAVSAYGGLIGGGAIGASKLVNTLASIPGGAVMGGGAGASAIYEAIDQGKSPEEALVYGMLSGLNEEIGETFSIEKLFSLRNPTSVLQAIGGIALQGVFEGSEEVVTSLLNLAASGIAYGDENDFAVKVGEYLAAGYDNKTAKAMALSDIVLQLGEDFEMGAISGGIMGGAQTINRTIGQANRDIQSGVYFGQSGGTLEALDKAAERTNGAGSEYYKSLNKDKITNRQVGKALRLINSDAMAGKIAEQLEKQGVDKDTAKTAASAIQKDISNYKVTDEEKATLENEAVAKTRGEVEDYIRNVSEGNETESWVGKAEEEVSSELTNDVRNAVLNKISNVTSADEDFEKSAVERGIIGTGTAQDAYTAYKEKGGQMYADEYLNKYALAERYGSTNASAESVKNIVDITEDVGFEEAFNREFNKSMTQAEAITEVSAERQEQMKKDGSRVFYATQEELQRDNIKGGKVIAPDTKLSVEQDVFKAAVQGMFSDTDVQILLFSADTIRGRSRTGKAVVNGGYQRVGNKIYLDINSNMVQVATHESVHWMKVNNRAMYNELRDTVRDSLSSRYSGGYWTRSVEDMRGTGADKLSFAQAEEEVVARAIQDINNDVDKVNEFAKSHSSIANKIYDYYKSAKKALRDALSKFDTTSNKFSARLAEDAEAMNKATEIWAEALGKSNDLSVKATQFAKDASTKTMNSMADMDAFVEDLSECAEWYYIAKNRMLSKRNADFADWNKDERIEDVFGLQILGRFRDVSVTKLPGYYDGITAKEVKNIVVKEYNNTPDSDRAFLENVENIYLDGIFYFARNNLPEEEWDKIIGDKNINRYANITELSIEDLTSALKSNGLMYPSIGITPPGRRATRYGEIALVWKPQTLRPDKWVNVAFAGDIYSKTVPQTLSGVDDYALDNIISKYLYNPDNATVAEIRESLYNIKIKSAPVRFRGIPIYPYLYTAEEAIAEIENTPVFQREFGRFVKDVARRIVEDAFTSEEYFNDENIKGNISRDNLGSLTIPANEYSLRRLMEDRELVNAEDEYDGTLKFDYNTLISKKSRAILQNSISVITGYNPQDNYYEMKPQRKVGLNEIGFMVVPEYRAGNDTIKTISDIYNIPVVTYSANEEDGYTSEESYENRNRAIRTALCTEKYAQDTMYSTTEKAPIFYSYMGKVINDSKQNKFDAKTLPKMLFAKGVKADEIKWSGIETFLEGKKSVTKDELNEFIAGSMNYILRYERGDEDEYFNNILRNHGVDPEEYLASETVMKDGVDVINPVTGEVEQTITDLSERERAQVENYIGKPKWSQYTIPGSYSNYREILFKMDSKYSNDAMRVHFGIPGILAHARIDDRIIDGKKYLFIEEIQSDWHNAGSKYGYAPSDKESRIAALVNERDSLKAEATYKDVQTAMNKYYEFKEPGSEYSQFIQMLVDDYLPKATQPGFTLPPEIVDRSNKFNEQLDNLKKDWENKRQKYDEYENKLRSINAEISKLNGITGTAPDAPFKKGKYIEYVMKTLLRDATENGYDGIAWTSAKQQEERWSEAFAEGYRIEYDQDMPNFVNKYAKKFGGRSTTVEIDTAIADSDVLTQEDALTEIYDYCVDNGVSISSDVEPTIERSENGFIISFFDDVGAIHSFSTGRKETGLESWVFDIPQAMRDSILYEGQPMYSTTEDTEGNKLTSAQASYFSESKVKRDGKILRMFHGTGERFSEFKREYINVNDSKLPGFWFTSNEDYAAGFGDVNEYYVNITNPIPTDRLTITAEDLVDLTGYSLDSCKQALRFFGSDYDAIENIATGMSSEEYSVFIDQVKDMFGYDGYIYDNNGTVAVAFDSNQAKSIYNREPTSSNDIMYSVTSDISDRELLAEALLEGRRGEDRKLLLEYKSDLEKMRAAMKERNAIIRKLKGSLDKSTRNALHHRVRSLNQSINAMDERLTNIRLMKPMRDIIEEQRKAIYDYEDTLLGEQIGAKRDLREAKREAKLDKERAVDKATLQEQMYYGRKMAEQANRADKELMKEQMYYGRKLAEQKQISEKLKQQIRDRIDKAKADRIADKERELVNHYKPRIEKLAKEISNVIQRPTSKKHINEAFSRPLSEFLSALDFTTSLDGEVRASEVNAKRIRMQTAMANLSAVLREQSLENGSMIDIDPNVEEWLRIMSSEVARRLSTVSNTNVAEMTGTELKTLYKLLKSIYSTVNLCTKMYTEANTDVSDVTVATHKFLRPLATNKSNRLSDKVGGFFAWNNAQPFTVFRRFGEGGERVFRMLEKGQSTMAYNVEKLEQFFAEAYDKKTVNSLRNDLVTIKLSGGEFTVTPAFLMSLHCLYKREGARKHLLSERGGFRFADLKPGRINFATPITRFEATTFTEADAAEIDKVLSQYKGAIELADLMQNWMSTQGSYWGNQVSLKRFGYRAFNEQYYFPIVAISKADKNATVTKRTNIYALLNKSFTKELSINANSAIVVGDIFTIVGNHMSEMALYNAYALPVLDTIKWFNYDDGSVSIKEDMRMAFGDNAAAYVERLLEDINNTKVSGLSEDMPLNLLRRYNKTMIVMNASVWAQQPFSIVRAMNVLGAQYFRPLVGKSFTEARDEMYAHSGIAMWKKLGYYDVDVSTPLRSKIYKNENVIDKINELGMKPAELGDEWTWTNLWVACRNWAKVNAKGQDLMTATENKFNDVIYGTQVVDSVLTRSELMRSDKAIHRMWTAFMSEPTTSYNVMLRAFDNLNLAIRSKDGKAAGKAVATAILPSMALWVISEVINAAVTAPIYGARKDDKYSTLWERIIASFKSSLKDNLNPLGLLPYLNNIKDIMDGFDVQRSDIAIPAQMITAIQTIKKAIDSGKFGYKEIYKVLLAMSTISNLPLSNTFRDGVALYNIIAEYAGVAEIPTVSESAAKSSGYDTFYQAVITGNQARAIAAWETMEDNDIEGKNVWSSIVSRVKKAYTEDKITDSEAKKYLTDASNWIDYGKTKDQIDKLVDGWEK